MEIWKAMVVLVAVLLVAPLASAAEDTNATPALGARVRATTTSGQIVGKLMMRTPPKRRKARQAQVAYRAERQRGHLYRKRGAGSFV